MLDLIQPILIILAVIIGGGALAYFYFSVDIFTNILKLPLRMISIGMIVINIGVILILYLAYQASAGMETKIFGFSISSCFYVLYFIGSVMVILGSRKFAKRPV